VNNFAVPVIAVGKNFHPHWGLDIQPAAEELLYPQCKASNLVLSECLRETSSRIFAKSWMSVPAMEPAMQHPQWDPQ